MKRNIYDLGHFTMKVGKFGRLQTLDVFRVNAGESLEFSLKGKLELAPLRRNIVLDTKVDLLAFYVPLRHVYGEDFVDFIQKGIDENETFPSIGVGTGNQVNYLGVNHKAGEALPRFLVTAYNQIWNRYFRDPTRTGEIADTEIQTSGEAAEFGRTCCWPKRSWNSLIDQEVDTHDQRVALSGGQLDVVELGKIQARLRTEREREWFAKRYKDVLETAFGSGKGVNIDADQRPELLMRDSFWLSGYDVAGSADATLGTYAGRAGTNFEFNCPRKYFNEHGVLFVLGLLRPPPVYATERNRLLQDIQLDYKAHMGDPDLISHEPPEGYRPSDWFNTGSTTRNFGELMPYGQWYREHPNLIHPHFSDLMGYPFLEDEPDNALYTADQLEEYDSMFQTSQLANWQLYARCDARLYSLVPGPKSSIFAGAK